MLNLKLASLLMAFLVAASNYLVKFPINDWLTWGAFTYPVTYLITELINRIHGPKSARRVVYVGFVIAIIFSATMDDLRIALASSSAFLISQLMDISIFTHLRRSQWWVAPAVASILATTIDTVIFFSAAFAGTELPWMTMGAGDFLVKVGMDLSMLLPFRIFLMNRTPVRPAVTMFSGRGSKSLWT